MGWPPWMRLRESSSPTPPPPGGGAPRGTGRNSPYTEALTHAMREMHEPVEQVFKHVRVGVMSATSGKQVPWESSSLTGDFYFAAPSKVAPETASALQSGAVPAGKAPAPSSAGDKSDTGSFGSWVSGLFAARKTAPDAPPTVTASKDRKS